MKILIELNTEEGTDLAALQALIRSLGGETAIAPSATIATVPAAAPPAAPPAPAAETPPASETLLTEEAARAAASGTAPLAEGTGLDIHGLPWDERIHAGTKAKNADGSWRGRRGVDDATVASVTAELKARVAAAAPPAEAPVSAPAASPETAFTPPAAPVAPAPPAPAAEAGAPPPPATEAAEAMTYPKIIRLVGEKGMSYDELNRIAALFGLPGFKELVGRPDLFESFVAALPA